jgi:exodeoxyribonuclease V alpha subunit
MGGGEAAASAAERLCEEVAGGHLCLPLGRLGAADGIGDAAAWREALSASPLVGPSDAGRPLVLAGDLFYLRRDWEEERALADAIRERCSEKVDAGGGESDPAERALARAGSARMTILCGGPGTGKTTLAGKILERVLRSGATAPGRVAMVAPTGRAARRLGEALAGAFPGGVAGVLPPARTLHSLLGAFPGESRPRHHRGNPLGAEFVVVDECSMVSLAQMRQLLDALPDTCRLLLLGDPSQLASVDAGAVLADLAEAAELPGHPLGDAVVTLTRNYRFSERSGIHRLATAVRSGDVARALEELDAGSEDLGWRPLPAPSELPGALRESLVAGFGGIKDAPGPEAALGALGGFRLLTPVRNGPYGIRRLNATAADLLLGPGAMGSGAPHGLPVLVTRNDPQRELFNGDTGIVFLGPEGGVPQAWFEDGGGGGGGARAVPVGALPPHESAYAVTVHKSQGSEHDRVLVLLPDEPGALVTRELLYTALTRARRRVDLWCSREALARAVENRTRRASGLVARLAEENRG